jgi:hypothetical protein
LEQREREAEESNGMRGNGGCVARERQGSSSSGGERGKRYRVRVSADHAGTDVDHRKKWRGVPWERESLGATSHGP